MDKWNRRQLEKTNQANNQLYIDCKAYNNLQLNNETGYQLD